MYNQDEELQRQNEFERRYSAALLSELNELYEAQRQPQLVIDDSGQHAYTEPPEYTTIRFVSRGAQYVAVRVGDFWYTSSVVGVWGSWTDSEVINSNETWTSICSLSTDIELAQSWTDWGAETDTLGRELPEGRDRDGGAAR